MRRISIEFMRKNYIALFVARIESLKNLKKKHLFFLIFAVSARMKMKNYLKNKNQLKY